MKINIKIKFDPNHDNDAGKYLGGLIWYSILFHDDLKNVSFKPQRVSDDFAAYLKKVAGIVLRKAQDGL
jgi:hypothetical protein